MLGSGGRLLKCNSITIVRPLVKLKCQHPSKHEAAQCLGEPARSTKFFCMVPANHAYLCARSVTTAAARQQRCSCWPGRRTLQHPGLRDGFTIPMPADTSTTVGHSHWPNYPLFMYGLNTDLRYMRLHLMQPSGHRQDGLAQQARLVHLEFQKSLQNSFRGKDGDVSVLPVVLGFTGSMCKI